MEGFERHYGTGRAVLALAAWIGWLVAALGLIVAGVGAFGVLASDAPLAAAAPLAAMAAGAGVLLIGILGVAAAQHMRATFDTADMTRELLALARLPRTAFSAPEAPPPLRATAPAAPHRPRLAGPTTGGGKVHPIFSARPPR